ncbi:MAG: hypothetical protein K0U63_04880 [Cyanobacteria bacterium]|nr:hypothetical protein [Cyanobacteriota bacterium]
MTALFPPVAPSRWRHGIAALLLACLLLGAPGAALAAELKVSEVSLEPCPAQDVAAQPDLRGAVGALCYALRGSVENPGRNTVVDTDVYARILDASGEPVLQNRTRVGSIGDVPPGRSSFALRLAVPAGTPGPLGFSSVKARGFKAPVRTRAGVDDDLLPLERALADQ